MTRVVIHFQPSDDESDRFSLAEPPITVPGIPRGLLSRLELRHDVEPFSRLALQDLPAGLVREIGTALYQELARHPRVKAGLERARQEGSPEDPHPIYLKVDTVVPRPDLLPWETLCLEGTGEFLSLDETSPVARIADIDSAEDIERFVDPPLRILVVISAAGIDGGPEWRALYEALQDTSLELGYSLRVMVADPALKATVESAAAMDPSIEIETLSDGNLQRAVADFRPHILHFFCHGDVVGSTPVLELATRSDVIRQSPRGNFFLEEMDLRKFHRAAKSSAFLVVLNCCLGAASEAETRSLVAGCVNAGFPAAIGMREPILNNDAHLFCRHFYGSLLAYLDSGLRAEDSALDIELAPLLAEARRQMCKKRGRLLSAAGDVKQWTLPVLYVRPEPSRLVRPPTQSGMSTTDFVHAQAVLQTLQQERTALARNGAPQALLRELDQHIVLWRARLMTSALPDEPAAVAPAAALPVQPVEVPSVWADMAAVSPPFAGPAEAAPAGATAPAEEAPAEEASVPFNETVDDAIEEPSAASEGLFEADTR